MAMDLQRTELRALLLKIQSVAGTPETLAAGSDGLLVINGDFKFSTDPLEREIDLAGHGARPFVNVKRRCTYSGGLELRGAATVGNAAPIGPALRTCGFSQALTASTSAVYSLATSGFEIATIEGYRNGDKVASSDARGAITKIEMSIRNFAKAMFEIVGLPAATVVADAAMISPTLTAFQAPVAIETETFEVDIGGVKLNAISLEVDTNAKPEIYEGSEKRFVYLKDFYRPTGKLRVFKEQRSSWNPESISLAHTLSDVYATIAGGGETVRLDMDSVQFGIAEPVDVDGIAAWDLPFRARGSNNTDCLKLSFLAPP